MCAQFQDTWRNGGTGIGAYIFKAAVASQVPLIVQGTTGQTANLLEAKNIAGTTVFSVSNSGDVTYLGDEYVTDQLTVNGNAIISGTLSAAATTLSSLSVTGATALYGGLTVTGNSSFGDETTIHTLTVQGEVKLQSGYIRSVFSANIHLLPSASCITIVGDAGTTSHSLAANDDLLVTGKLEVDGAAFFDGAVTLASTLTTTGVVMFPNGTAAAPSITFTSDPDTGLFSAGANNLGISAKETVISYFTATTNYTDSFFYTPRFITPLTGNYPISLAGRIADGATAVGVVLDNSTALVTEGAKLVSIKNATTEKAAIGLNGEVMAGAGTNLLPSLSFLGDPNSGFYSYGADSVGLTTGGTVNTVWSGSGFQTATIGAINNTSFRIYSQVANGASAIGLIFDNSSALTTAGAKIVKFSNATVEKAFIDKDGGFGQGKTLVQKVFYTTVTLDTTGAETNVGLTPAGPMISAAIRVSTQITGLDSADHHIKLGVSGMTDKYIDVSQGGAATTIDVNKKGNSGMDGFGTPEEEALILTIDGGADNTPSAGAVEVEIHYWALSDLPSV